MDNAEYLPPGVILHRLSSPSHFSWYICRSLDVFASLPSHKWMSSTLSTGPPSPPLRTPSSCKDFSSMAHRLSRIKAPIVDVPHVLIRRRHHHESHPHAHMTPADSLLQHCYESTAHSLLYAPRPQCTFIDLHKRWPRPLPQASPTTPQARPSRMLRRTVPTDSVVPLSPTTFPSGLITLPTSRLSLPPSSPHVNPLSPTPEDMDLLSTITSPSVASLPRTHRLVRTSSQAYSAGCRHRDEPMIPAYLPPFNNGYDIHTTLSSPWPSSAAFNHQPSHLSLRPPTFPVPISFVPTPRPLRILAASDVPLQRPLQTVHFPASYLYPQAKPSGCRPFPPHTQPLRSILHPAWKSPSPIP
ncbi:hypothetical protein DACRYDRAFT_108111 [Dacryopinax primogenitus]|uniref:Uncharacterized protein n=1 Tax=Dacryopinax primogenitus (strain DJM 731) TaxID=1858805 RepID=M5FUX5_DACPD|nr:uncharacterized protein DACRYDRAFT_108111 [Dacryopinax primogenitus]EJU01571.1 hypothetical protein DACRYDRAFT_108111 [Dacryopinax primogenitus]